MRNLLLYIMQWYWRIFRPRTFGVKVLILHPQLKNQVLLVRHTYGNQQRWNLPGGGYKPKNESPVEAATREVLEEVRVRLEDARVFGEHYSELQGKRDTVALVVGTIADYSSLTTSGEIASFEWVQINTLASRENVAAIVKIAAAKFQG